MFFIDAPHSLYSARVVELLFATVGRPGWATRYTDHKDPTDENKDVHIDLTLWHETNGYRALIEVFDHGERIATFAQSGLPEYALVQPEGVGRERISENFWANATDILLHDNVFAQAANAMLPKFFAEKELTEFFSKVFPRLQKVSRS
jgi:hypothetical protein